MVYFFNNFFFLVVKYFCLFFFWLFFLLDVLLGSWMFFLVFDLRDLYFFGLRVGVCVVVFDIFCWICLMGCNIYCYVWKEIKEYSICNLRMRFVK